MLSGAASRRLELENPLVRNVPIPVPLAAATTLVGESGGASTKQPALHWWAGLRPVLPWTGMKVAPLLSRVSELAGSVEPSATYPGPAWSPHSGAGQYCFNTGLLPGPSSPLTEMLHPRPVPLASLTSKLATLELIVWA